MNKFRDILGGKEFSEVIYAGKFTDTIGDKIIRLEKEGEGIKFDILSEPTDELTGKAFELY